MEFEQVKEWLDALIEVDKISKSLETLTSEITTISARGYVQLFSGIEAVADIMGKELHSFRHDDGEHLEVYFEYNDYRILQIKRI